MFACGLLAAAVARLREEGVGGIRRRGATCTLPWGSRSSSSWAWMLLPSMANTCGPSRQPRPLLASKGCSLGQRHAVQAAHKGDPGTDLGSAAIRCEEVGLLKLRPTSTAEQPLLAATNSWAMSLSGLHAHSSLRSDDGARGSTGAAAAEIMHP